MNINKKTKIIILKTFFNFILLSSLFIIIFSFGPFLVYELEYRIFLLTGKSYSISETGTSDSSLINSFLNPNQIIYIKPKSPDFGIVITKIALNEEIKDVNSEDDGSVTSALRDSVGRAIGTSLPSENGNMYLFAHSSTSIISIDRYNSVFTLLRNLNKGDKIYIFYHNIQYIYEVYDKYTVPSDDTKDITFSSSFPQLTLQTCDPPGMNFNRLIIKAKKI